MRTFHQADKGAELNPALFTPEAVQTSVASPPPPQSFTPELRRSWGTSPCLAALLVPPSEKGSSSDLGSFERKHVRAVDVASEMVIQEALTVTHP